MGFFNENQLKAITSSSKYILCLAGAGSGKTTVLTSRIAYLTKNRVSCNNILALTFTRLAGNEMKERIIKLIGEKEGKKLFCNTFHSFCVKVLKEYGYQIGYSKEFTIYDEQDKESIIEAIIKDLFLKTKYEEVLDVLKNDWQLTDHPEMADAITAINEYRYRLKKNNAIDLDMLLTETLKLLENYSEVKDYYHNLYDFVFIDEFQDTNDIQMKIIKAIEPKNLFVVGDDFQAIYGWRDAKIEYILDFEKNYPGCEVIKLEENYRSVKPIIDAANNVIEFNKNQTRKTLKAQRDGNPIEYIELDNVEDEAKAVTEKIYEYGDAFKENAVLSRTNAQLETIAGALKKFAIPYQIVTNKDDVFNKRDIRMVMKFIDCCINSKDDATVKKIINFPEQRLSAEQIIKLEAKALEKELSIFEGLQSFKFKPPSDIKINHLVETINSIENFISEKSDNALEVYNFTVDALELSKHYNDTNRSSKVEDLVGAAEKITKWMEKQNNIGEETNIKMFLKYLKIKDIQEKLAENSDTVKLMTVHAAKGLEFKNVFVIGMNEDIFPNKRGDIEEERRLFYVAITRAKERLIITRPTHIQLPYMKKPKETIESQFIKEMQNKL